LFSLFFNVFISCLRRLPTSSIVGCTSFPSPSPFGEGRGEAFI
jgi:hypothetical protein